MGNQIIVFFVIFCVQFTNGEGTDNKRLLLNDPDVSAARLLQLEKSMQTFTSTVQGLAYLVTTLNGTLQTVNTDLAAEKVKTTNHDATIQTLKTENVQLMKTVSTTASSIQNHGSTYVRWGRSGCPLNKERVYTGYADGSVYRHGSYYGGPSNMLCLPSDPELSNRTAPGSSFIYGTEYQENFFAPNAFNEDVPCAVWRNPNSFSSLMIPGRKTCYDGWQTEYKGYLASGCYSCKASSFICVDSQPEYIPSGTRDDNGHLLYVVGAKCGSLPCPPYHDKLELYCVVCSK
ncbi:unnamed protein product [Mytilus coruscus]|uniref:Uncharacterized protein n=1 Tax=Mytilus coruscus TaxID=42192 RepID=A0A6J8AMI7_MYTCO|nr:unnamed protein product [Mytilus coruscus]